MKEFMDKTMEIFGHEEEGGTDAAKEAISADMAMAMMKYMPLRGMLSFGGGPESAKEMENLLEQLNKI